MSTRAIPLRVPEGLLELATWRGREERTDQATTLRQWLYAGAEEYILKLLSEGRISTGRAAELLDMSIYDIQRLVREHGVEVGPTAEQVQPSFENADRLAATHTRSTSARKKKAR